MDAPAVFGVSFGGAIALELAAEYPDRLGALILHGVEATVSPDDRLEDRAPRARAVSAAERQPTSSTSFSICSSATKPEPGPLVDFVVDRIWETGQSVMAERLAQLESFNISDRLWSIGAPTLVLAGGRDAIVPPLAQRALAAEISDAPVRDHRQMPGTLAS